MTYQTYQNQPRPQGLVVPEPLFQMPWERGCIRTSMLGVSTQRVHQRSHNVFKRYSVRLFYTRSVFYTERHFVTFK